MSDICVQFSSRTGLIHSVQVPPPENRRSLQTNEGVHDPREDRMELEETRTTRRRRCGEWGLCAAFTCALVGVFVGFLVGQNTATIRNKAETEVPHSGLASSQTGSIEINTGGRDVRITPDTSGCEDSSYVECRAEVPSPHLISSSPLNCPHRDDNVQNKSCYLCGGQCKTLNDLLDEPMNGAGIRLMTCGERRFEIQCCTIRQMSNLNNVCGVGGEYNCYSGGPKCKCPLGKSGNYCQNSSMNTLKCKCFKTAFKFCATECNSTDRGTDVTQCQMSVVRRGESRNCICNKTDADESENNNLESCSIPHTDALTNDSTQLVQKFALYIVMLVILLVDKT